MSGRASYLFTIRPDHRFRRLFSLLPILLFVLLPTLSGQDLSIRALDAALAGGQPVEYVEGELLVRFREGLTEEGMERVRSELQIEQSRRIGRTELFHLQLDPQRVEDLIGRRIDYPELAYLQPNYVYRLIRPAETDDETAPGGELQQAPGGLFPDDPEFNRQWGLYNEGQFFRPGRSGLPGADISAVRAWEVTTGSEEVIVAIFDTGIDYEHPDLADNMFLDSQGRHGVDCSPSGMTAGICGDDPMDSNGHGTHVAGIVGAVGNNGTGLAGVNWRVRLMAVKVFSEDPNDSNVQISTSSSILAGYDYALANGARISNHSYRTGSQDQAQRLKIQQAGEQGHLVVAAAGNSETNNDQEPVYPASYDLENVIAVAATDARDELAWFSNFGPQTVDIAAPGEDIFSTLPGDTYGYRSGTSMAAPHVAGAAGLVLSLFPDIDYGDIRRLLLEEADRPGSLQGRIRESRRLNAYESLPAAGLHFVAASLDPEASEVDVRINGRTVATDIRFRQTTDMISVPAGTDLEIAIYPTGSAAGQSPLAVTQEQFPRDRNFYLVLTGSGSGKKLSSNEIRPAELSQDEVSVTFFKGVSGISGSGLYGFYPDNRPPFVIVEEIAPGLFLDRVRLRSVDFEVDLTSGPELLDSFVIPVSETGGESLLAVFTGDATGERELLLSRGPGMGDLAVRTIPPGGAARHVPGRFELEENFPNPFSSITNIQFTLPEARDVRLEVYDILGRQIRLLIDETLPVGIHRFEFDAAGLSSGIYLYRVRAGEEVRTGRMMLVR